MIPTDEQAAALELFRGGDSMVIEAGAGTGKTSTLKILAEDADARGLSGRYLAFNKAIVLDVNGKLPNSCAASTAHSLAFRSIGNQYAHRLNSPRMKPWDQARILGVRYFSVRVDDRTKVLQDAYLAGLVMRAVKRFCQTADEEPTRRHVEYIEGIDTPDGGGRRTYYNNNRVAEYLEPYIQSAWADLQQLEGELTFGHEHYLKLWQLSHPRTEVDYILFDEAQDANPVMAAVIAEQDHAQRVYVGDSNQAIYEFTGAVNALANIDEDNRRLLTQSFRFGPAIAEAANDVLLMLESDMRLQGLPTIVSSIGRLDTVDDADAVLCRTNAGAIRVLLNARDRGITAHLVGGGKEIVSFARAAQKLMQGQKVQHPELACFESWGEVREYVESDAQGADLKLLVGLIDDFGVPTIIGALDNMPREQDAQLIASTAHKSKGREWPTVLIGEDFARFTEADASEAELRLRYVATTRAREHLDNSSLLQKVAF